MQEFTFIPGEIGKKQDTNDDMRWTLPWNFILHLRPLAATPKS
jgi:hypothetical protein